MGAHKTRRDRAEQYAIWALVLAFVVLAGVYSVVTPLYEASDELWHYPFVKNLADGRGLPVQDPTNPGPWAQEGSQPPLYYALAALISRSVAEDDPARVLRPNPHANIGAVMPDGNANMALHTAVESFPYRGTVLAIHLVRAYSVLLGAVTVLFTYAIGMELLPDRPALALAAAGVVAFTPMFLFISGSVNNDNLVVALATVALWQMLRLVRLGPTAPRWALLGATIGLAALTKLSGLALLAPAGLVLVWLTWRKRQQWRMALWGGLCIVGGVALLAGWWYYRNWRLYGDPLGLNVFLTIAGRRGVRPSLTELLGEWSSLVKSYWGVFGGMNVVPPEWFYGLLNGLAVFALLGLGLEAGRRLVHRRWPEREALFRFGLVALWPAIVMASLVRWTMMTMASQGRLIFPAIASISYLLVLGVGVWAPRRRALPGLAAMAIMAVLAAWTPFGVIAPAYAPRRLLTPAELAAIPERLDLEVGEGMELLGYRLDTREVRPGDDLAVTLYWRARARMDQDYSVFVHLLDQNGIKIAQRDRYPGRGLFPTIQWRPGDAIADTYFVHVPENTFNPNRLTLEVGLYVLGGERLPIRDREGRALGDAVRLPEIRLHAEARDGIANPLAVNLSGKARLVGYDLDRTAVPAGETLDLTLFWKPLAPLAPGHRAFAVLRAWDGAVWVGAAGRSDTEAGRAWQPGQVLTDTLSLVLPPDMPPGEYYVDAGMYAGAASQRLSVVGRGGRLEGDRYALTRIRVLPATQPGESGSPSPQHPLDVTFPGVARLVGYRIDQQVVNPYERLRLTLYWEAVNEDVLSKDYTVFTHLLDAGSRVVAQHDGPPASGWRPTSSWRRGEVIIDPHHLAFSDLSFAGEGVVEVGLYDPATMQRLLTATGEDRVVLSVRVEVKP